MAILVGCRSYAGCIVERELIALRPPGIRSAAQARRKSSPAVVVAQAAKNGRPNGLPSTPPKSRFVASPAFWLQEAAVLTFMLGFIDAGYSGDWSRIGVLSMETEALLRMASFGVVPISLFLLWIIFQNSKESE